MKFLFIASFSGVGAIANAPAGVIRSDAKWRAQVTNAMTEIYTLAQARGINSPSSSIETVMASVDALPEDATRSMQRDIAAGKPSELDHRTEQSYAWPVKPPLTFQHMSSYTER